MPEPDIYNEEFSLSNHLNQLPTFNHSPIVCGTIRQHYADFDVTEILSFEPCGQGEHLFLYIEKQSCNSQWVADELQKHFKLRSQDIGYAGKKDRHSLSRQWFSLHLPGKENEVSDLELNSLNNSSFKVLKSIRHNKKLRKGVIKHNHFKIKVVELSGKIDEAVINNIITNGFPNYFGYQRFGHNGDNLVKAQQLFNNQIRVRSRNKKGIYLSAARSYLFNLLVAERLKQKNWDRLINGDCLNLAGSHSYFVCEKIDNEIIQRLKLGDVHISGLLAGKSAPQVTLDALSLENLVLQKYPSWLNGLDKEGVVSARRPMRVIPQNFKLTEMDEKNLIIEFSLPSGSFATSLLRELLIITDDALPKSTNDDEIL